MNARGLVYQDTTIETVKAGFCSVIVLSEFIHSAVSLMYSMSSGYSFGTRWNDFVSHRGVAQQPIRLYLWRVVGSDEVLYVSSAKSGFKGEQFQLVTLNGKVIL